MTVGELLDRLDTLDEDSDVTIVVDTTGARQDLFILSHVEEHTGRKVEVDDRIHAYESVVRLVTFAS